MTIADRKIFELQQKLAGLTVELDHWRAESVAGKPYEKHHSQIRLASAALQGGIARIEEEVNSFIEAHDSTRVLTECRRIEDSILELHSVWDFFRRKLLLRGVDAYRKYLYAADELAWACYEPPQRHSDLSQDDVREPPLVFFNSCSSPLAASRGQRYSEEIFPGENPINPQFTKIVDSLPVPVISVPWFQIEHLPDALVIAHEVGHNVEQDFQLTAKIDGALSSMNLDGARRDTWLGWRSEIFADYYGSLAAGPAFAETLIDFLADAPQAIEAEEPVPWNPYPPSWLRVQLVLQAIKIRGFEDEAGQLRDQWAKCYAHQPASEFGDDVTEVIATLDSLKFSEFGNRRLSDILAFKRGDYKAAHQAATFLRDGRYSSLKDYNVRTLLAAVRLAFSSNSQKYVADRLGHEVLDKIPQKAGTRRTRLINSPQELHRREQVVRSKGTALLEMLPAWTRTRQ